MNSTSSAASIIAQTYEAQQNEDPKTTDLQSLVGGPVYLIPDQNLNVLEIKLGKLNVRAGKLNVAPITITTEPAPSITITSGEYKGDVIERTFVIVHGSTPKLAGWQFVATLEHDEGAVILRRLPTFEREVSLAAYTHATPENCDHCGVKRYRKDTYVVAHDDGTLKQVGSTCLGDFIGGTNPQAVARYCESIADFLDEMGDYEDDFANYAGGGARYEQRIDIDYYLGHVACMIRNHGWISKTAARESYDGQLPTAVQALDNITAERRRRGEARTAEVVLTDDIELAAKSLEWVRSLSEDEIQPTERGDYLWNLAAVCTKDSIRYRQTGIAASVISAYQRVLGRQAERKAQAATSSPIIEGKIEITGTVLKLDFIENEFGTRHVMTVLDDRGFKVWGSVPSVIYKVKVGDKVAFTATVEKSDRDDSFGFYKRPSKASITEEAA